MPVILQCFSLVIRRDRIAAVFPGGWAQFVAERGLPPEEWWDDDLVRLGAMNNFQFEMLVNDARALGLRLTSKRDEREVFQDMCVLASPENRLSLPCNWIDVRPDGTASFAGSRRKPRRPRIKNQERMEHAERTLDAILGLLALPPAERFFLPLHRRDGATGTLRTEPGTRRSLVVDGEAGHETFRWAEDVVNAGWEVLP